MLSNFFGCTLQSAMAHWTWLTLGISNMLSEIRFGITFSFTCFRSQATLTICSYSLKCLKNSICITINWYATTDSIKVVVNKLSFEEIFCFFFLLSLTSHRLSGPWIKPLFKCMPELILKLARMRCLSGPELNLYNRSNSAKKCVSSSFANKWTPHTGHEFDGGVPIFVTFLIAIEVNEQKMNNF